MPEQIQQLMRPVQVAATISQTPTAATLTLSTALGEVVLTLPQLAADQQQKLLQQLLALFQSQRPLTLQLQPGNPPQQATILLPSGLTVSAQNPNLSSGALSSSATVASSQQPPPLPVTIGTVLSAITLPSNSPIPAGLSSAPPTENTFSALSTLSPSEAEALAVTAGELLAQVGEAEISLSLLNSVAARQAIVNAATATGQPAAPVASATPSPVTPNATAATASEPSPLPSSGAPTPANQQSVSTTAATTATTAQTTTPPSPATLPSSPQPSAPVATASVSQAQPVVNALVPGQQIGLRIDAITPPNAPAQPAAPLADNQIAATVTGKGTNGELILQSGDKAFYIRQPTDLPVGTNLVLTLSAMKTDAPTILADADGVTFSSLQQMMAALAQIDPPLAQQINASVMPQPNAQLPGTLLFFLNVLQQGNLRSWIGNPALDRLTQAGKLELINRFMQEIAPPSHTLHDAVVGEWKPYMIPMRIDQHFEAINLYVHRDKRDGSEPHDPQRRAVSQIRFLIDMNMSRLGSLQLDGLVRPRKLDMIVRSEHPLPQGLSQDLRAIYTNTLDVMGYTGGIIFQTGRQNWLTMQRKGTSREI